MLFPVAVTFFITWWFIQFVDGFFSPLYEGLGIDIFGKFRFFSNHPVFFLDYLSLCVICLLGDGELEGEKKDP